MGSSELRKFAVLYSHITLLYTKNGVGFKKKRLAKQGSPPQLLLREVVSPFGCTLLRFAVYFITQARIPPWMDSRPTFLDSLVLCISRVIKKHSVTTDMFLYGNRKGG